MIYAFDSNIISGILKRDEAIINKYREEAMRGGDFIIPPIVFYEVQRGLLAKNLFNRLEKFENFCQNLEIGEFNFEIWQKAAQIHAMLSQQGKPIGGKYDGDVFIAAYCIVNDYTLVTNNTKDFGRIDGLKFVNWKI